MPHHKLTLAEKDCLHCKRPFKWRKKWEHDWNNVKYCSDRCRKEARLKPDASTELTLRND